MNTTAKKTAKKTKPENPDSPPEAVKSAVVEPNAQQPGVLVTPSMACSLLTPPA